MQINSKVFTLPSVEVGSILEYRYDLRYDDDHVSSPTWEIQRPYFVHHARYTFTPFKAFLPGGTSMGLTGRAWQFGQHPHLVQGSSGGCRHEG